MICQQLSGKAFWSSHKKGKAKDMPFVRVCQRGLPDPDIKGIIVANWD
jgi:hypothetical protein